MDNSNGNARLSRGRAADSREPSRAASELFGDAGNTARISARRGPRGKHSHAPPSPAPAGAGDGGAWECLPLGPLRAEIRAVFPASPKSSDAALDGSRESAARPRDNLAFPLELSISPPRSICLVSLQTYRQNLRLADDFHHRPAAGETG